MSIFPTATAKLADLKADEKNARVHDEQNLLAIKDSLVQFGQVEPLVVQASTGRVIGGNGRLAAMQELQWDECQVTRIDITDEKAAALGIALNRSAELAEWNVEALEELLRDLQPTTDLSQLGFSAQELEELLQQDQDQDLPQYEQPEAAIQPEAAPSQPAHSAPQVPQPAAAQPAAYSPPEPSPTRPIPPTVNARVVQIMLSPDQADDFYELAEKAQEKMGTDDLASTLLAALRRA